MHIYVPAWEMRETGYSVLNSMADIYKYGASPKGGATSDVSGKIKMGRE